MKSTCPYGGLEYDIPSLKNLFVGRLFFWPVFDPVERKPCPAGWFKGPSKDVIDNHATTQARS